MSSRVSQGGLAGLLACIFLISADGAESPGPHEQRQRRQLRPEQQGLGGWGAATIAAAVATGTASTVEAQSRTALHEAVGRQDRNAVLLLLDRRANVDARDGRGWTPLHEAVRPAWRALRGVSQTVVADLLDRGADVGARDSVGRMPLHLAAGGQHPGVVVELLRRGADVNARDARGRTPLHEAAREGSGDVMLALLDRGADVDAPDALGRTPLKAAQEDASRDPGELAELLRWKGADVEGTPLEPGEVQVEVSVSSVLRVFGPERHELAYVEAVLFGPFFERGRSDELTIRRVPDPTRGALDVEWFRNRDGRDPWRAFRSFRGDVMELYRGARLLDRVRADLSWLVFEGLSHSPRTGLLSVHLLDANPGSGPSDLVVLRYEQTTATVERLRVTYDETSTLMACRGAERPWPPRRPPGRTALFRPCRLDVGRLDAYLAAMPVASGKNTEFDGVAATAAGWLDSALKP